MTETNTLEANDVNENQLTLKLGWYRKVTSATFITLFIPIIGVWIFWTGAYAGSKDDPKPLGSKSKYLALIWGLILATHLTSPSAKAISGVAATAFALIGIGLVLISKVFNWKEKIMLVVAGGLAMAMFNASVGKQQEVADQLRQSSYGKEVNIAFDAVLDAQNMKGDKADKIRVAMVNALLMCNSAYLSKSLDKKELKSALASLDDNRSPAIINGHTACMDSLEASFKSKLDSFRE